MTKRHTVSEAARSALAQTTINGNQLKLSDGQLERGVYLEVDQVLSRLGGKWKGGKIAAHIFAIGDMQKLREALDSVIRTGLFPAEEPSPTASVQEERVSAKKHNSRTKSIAIVYPDWSIGRALRAVTPISCAGYACERVIDEGDYYTLHRIKTALDRFDKQAICRQCIPFVENPTQKDRIALIHEYATTTPKGQDERKKYGPTLGEIERGLVRPTCF